MVGPLSALVISLPIVVAVVVTLSTLPVLPVSVIALGLTLVASRLAGHVERFRLAALTGVALSTPHRPTEGPLWRRVIAWLRSGATWKELGYHLANLPVAVLFAAVAVAAWALGLALALLPLYLARTPSERAVLLWWTVEPGAGALLAAAVGVVVLLSAPWVTRGLGRLSLGMAEGLLGGDETDVLRRRVDTLEASRADVVAAAEVERRRIERDLHDGAQQRLVALAMTLGLAKQKMATDPARAEELVDEAHREAKNALIELRDLARGLHPPVLSDRGLEAAIAGLASRTPVPVEVDVRIARRSPPSIEGIAYFVISEALTNVARHSGAHRAVVRVVDTGPALVVEVDDDGVGDASTDRGTGLRGLADRVAAVDGTFRVTSPAGGPTTVRAELPLTRPRDHPAPCPLDRRSVLMRIVIAEDSVLLRDGLARLLTESGEEVVGLAGDAEEALSVVEATRPDILVTDVRMPPGHTDEGLRAAIEVRDRWPGTAVLVLSQWVEEHYATDLLAGSTDGVGYLLKDRVADVADFVEAVRRVGAGGTALDPEVVSQLLATSRNQSPLEALTPRETEVLTLMAEGRSNRAIAEALVVSDGAVEKHVSNIFMKLDLPTATDGHRRVLAVLRYLDAAP